MLIRVVLAVEDGALRRRLVTMLRKVEDVVLEPVAGGSHLWERALRRNCDVLVAAESAVPTPIATGMALAQEAPSSPAVIVLSPNEDASRHAELVAAGCDEVLYAGLPGGTLSAALEAILQKRRGQAEQSIRFPRLPAQPRLTDFISESPAMTAFLRTVQRVVASDTSLLILGETGVGKERLARAIHAEGPRLTGPFVAVNCGALPESLLESDLFGHEEGAFTGATRSRRGAFELAHRGVIFLDEIGEMPLHLQVKLLRVLQEHEIQRVGSEKAITADVRVMAATNRDLEAEVEAGRFRRDLYYRLSVVTLTIPPLRERREDIPELVESYLTYLRARVGRPVTGIAADALEALTRYSWPGNVRELINVIERAMLLCEDEEVSLNDLPSPIRSTVMPIETDLLAQASMPSPDDVPHAWLERPLAEVREDLLRKFEHVYLVGLLRETGGRINETARRAGIRPRSLYDKMKHHGLRKEDFRRPLTR